jgi:hypothetical protein
VIDTPGVRGRCPACSRTTLILGAGGYVTCAHLDCPNPSAASEALDRPTDTATEVDLLRTLVDELRDPDPCRYDHHGYCQAHWWFYTEPVCPHARAAAMFPDTPEEPTP